MRKIIAISLIVALALIGNAAIAEVTLFGGNMSGISFGGWGSGTAVAATDKTYVGSASIKIISQGLHEGGRIDFIKPIEILPNEAAADEYLQFTFWFTSIPLSSQGTFISPGFGITAVPGLLNSQMAEYYYQESEVPFKARVNTVRIVLSTEDGRSVEASTGLPMKSDDGWYTVAIPLKAMGLKAGTSFPVSRVLIFSDISDTFYLGEMKTIRDDTPITVEPLEEMTIAINDTVLFRAVADGGASMLKYSWNFGDTVGDAEGKGEDASGEVASHRYGKGGQFKARLTVSDIYGIKSPVTVETPIIVND